MKKLIIMSALVIGGLGVTTADAQFGIHINLHLGNRPVYVPAPPVEVIDQPVYNDDNYYYLPDVEAYYSVNERCYYYQDGERWISAAYLPGRYHDFDWRYAKRFEIHANRPYMHNEAYRSRFGGYANRDDYYARAYPERGRYPKDNFRGHDQFDNRGWGQQNRGGFDRRDDRNQNAYNQPMPGRNQGGNYNQPQPNSYNQGGYSQPAQNQNQGSYNQPAQNTGRNQGGNNINGQGGNNNGSQPSQGQQGGRGNGQGQNQPANQNGGQNNGSFTGADHYAANKMGVVQDRGQFARPVRN